MTEPGGYDDTTYTYSVSGADRGVFAVDGTTGLLSFKTGHEPDFEYQNSYSITVHARSGEGARRLTTTLDMTVEVVDGEDAGAVALSQRQRQVGIVVHATASDDDGGVTVTRWVWELSDVVSVNERGIPPDECRDDPATPGIDVVRGWTPIMGGAGSGRLESDHVGPLSFRGSWAIHLLERKKGPTHRPAIGLNRKKGCTYGRAGGGRRRCGGGLPLCVAVKRPQRDPGSGLEQPQRLLLCLRLFRRFG